MPRTLLALGSNQGDARSHILRAFGELKQLPHTSLVAESTLYHSQAVGGPAGQPRFANAAGVVETSLDCYSLLRELQWIEHQLKRRRGVRWDARTIDLDLLLYDDLLVDCDSLVVPHPRMSFRPFVLQPAVEVAGEWVHPRLLVSLQELQLAAQDPTGGLLIYGGKEADRVYHRDQLTTLFKFLSPDRGDSHALWLAAGEATSPRVARLAIQLVDEHSASRPGIPTLRIPATARHEVLYDTKAAVEAVWGDLGLGQLDG